MKISHLRNIDMNAFILLFFLMVHSAGTKTLTEAETGAALVPQLVDAVDAILAQRIEAAAAPRHLNVFIYVRYERVEYRYHLNDLANMLLQRALPAHTHSISDAGSYRPQAQFVLILVDTVASLRAIYVDEATGNTSHTIVYIATLHDHWHAEAQEAMQLFWQLSVLNVGIVLQPAVPASEFVLVTYFPFGVTGCQRTNASIINRYSFDLGAWTTSVYFPQKLQNFYGCTLTCATWEDMPYLVMKKKKDGIKQFIGIEGALLEFMADNLNFSIGIYMLNKEQVLATFNETGWIFNEIFSSAADYALGGFHNKPADEAHVVPYSQSTYYFMSHIMIVTNLQFAYSTYEKLAFPFHDNVWLSIGLTFAFGCVVISGLRSRWSPLAWRHFILGKRAYATPYYHMFTIAMGASMHAAVVPQRNLMRYLLCIWLIGTLVLRDAYQSGMYRLLRDNTQRNPPQTIDAVLAQGYAIAMIPENVRFLNSLPELSGRQLRFLNTSELNAFPTLAINTASRMAIITPYEYFGYYRKLHVSNRRLHLHLVRERVFTQQLSFYVRRNSYLVAVLDAQIQQAHSFGFLEHWTRRYVGAVDDSVGAVEERATVTAAMAANDKLNVLSLNELAGIFWITLWLHLGATVVFGLELLVKYWDKKKNHSQRSASGNLAQWQML